MLTKEKVKIETHHSIVVLGICLRPRCTFPVIKQHSPSLDLDFKSLTVKNFRLKQSECGRLQCETSLFARVKNSKLPTSSCWDDTYMVNILTKIRQLLSNSRSVCMRHNIEPTLPVDPMQLYLKKPKFVQEPMTFLNLFFVLSIKHITYYKNMMIVWINKEAVCRKDGEVPFHLMWSNSVNYISCLAHHDDSINLTLSLWNRENVLRPLQV